MPVNLLANIDLPLPGAPIIIILCPPAAAISSALLALICPLTSHISKVYSKFFIVFTTLLLRVIPSSINLTTSLRFLTAIISISFIIEASSKFSSGIITPLNPLLLANKTPLIMPSDLLTSPVKESSPISRYSLKIPL